jgi:glycerophosphoryl diester phosphodiesterase
VFGSRRPLVFAHRGGCALGPENTIAAFDLGMAAGADGLELDVHLSSDGIVVVHHDATLNRTTNASGPIAALTAAELARVDAGCRFSWSDNSRSPSARVGVSEHTHGSGIPTLEDVLHRYPGAPIIIEMKVDSDAMGLAVAELIRRTGTADRVCAAGFGQRSLNAVRAAYPGLTTSASQGEARLALYRSWVRWPVRHVRYRGYQVPEVAGRLRVVSPRFVECAHAAGLEVQVWTIDEPEDMRRLLEWGVDALITNRPDVAVRVRDSFLAGSEHG